MVATRKIRLRRRRSLIFAGYETSPGFSDLRWIQEHEREGLMFQRAPRRGIPVEQESRVVRIRATDARLRSLVRVAYQ
jgi:hypothetical protein